ncbi:MAG: hypothetical protein EOM91_17125 [Sphingobacteriia bacterium]|nr:hypothetical protein [Sphingobacteriia bacterium]
MALCIALPCNDGKALLDAQDKTKTLFRYRDLFRAHLGPGSRVPLARVWSSRSSAAPMSDPADLINLAIETLTRLYWLRLLKFTRILISPLY